MDATEIVIGIVDCSHVAVALIAIGKCISSVWNSCSRGPSLDKMQNIKKNNRTGPICPRRPALLGLDNSGVSDSANDGRRDCEHHGLI
jgi:hypothetical protein